ncbi:MAG: isoaspartyl peptidase/L-asparaginase [Bdellovibrionaceae bacterium]|nr:isoaspartyl peptidase/L-asparaginase [Bdellovibrionales bacterium]MCB9083547.1 isoaspartyl peptidase/L-asparaginase [Pseudobdellovibrionaceae bacterium]
MDERLSEIYLRTGSRELGNLVQRPLTLIHGGAGPGDPKGERIQEARTALQTIISELQHKTQPPAELGWLSHPARQVDCPATRMALNVAVAMERHPSFNAGIGSVLQEDGKARLSASFMESQYRQFTAVMNGQDYPFASLLAFALQGEKHGIRDADGVEDLIRQWDLPRFEMVTATRSARWIKQMMENPRRTGSHGTIGCVSLDGKKHLASVTSTGGVGYEPRGRVGDTPTIAGNYTSRRAAVSCTGRGEQIIDLALAVRVATRVDEGQGLSEALGDILKEGLEREMSLAAIAVAWDDDGLAHWALGSTAPTFIWGRIEDNSTECF